LVNFIVTIIFVETIGSLNKDQKIKALLARVGELTRIVSMLMA
jgi:hypothetical protein